MHRRKFVQFRILTALLLGVAFLFAAAASRVFLTTFAARAFAAIFGFAWFVQAGFLQRDLARHRPSSS